MAPCLETFKQTTLPVFVIKFAALKKNNSNNTVFMKRKKKKAIEHYLYTSGIFKIFMTNIRHLHLKIWRS